MYVSIVFNTEYMPVSSRIRWFLKSAYLAMRDDCLVITHEYMKRHLEELIQSCGKSVFAEYDIPELTPEEIRKLDICYVPDSVFEKISAEKRTQTGLLTDLFNNRNEEIEQIMINAIESRLGRNGGKLDFILNNIHAIASVRYLSEYFNAPLIPYVFSAVRKAHGYNQTLYMAHFDSTLFNSDAAKKMYEGYDCTKMPYPLLNKQEILALLGKKRNIPLIPLVNSVGIFEMGVIGECFRITPQIYQNENIIDDDLYFEAERFYNKNQIITRLHPTQMDQAGITRKHMKNDPASFVLSTKRIATVQSQMIIKGAMWNRTPCVLGDALPYAFLFTRDFQSSDPLSDEDLNYILFCYFVPDCCMFDEDYWKWRKTNPPVEDIAKRHFDAIIDNLSFNKDILMEKSERLERILSERGVSATEILKICQFNKFDRIDFDCLSSRIRVEYKDGRVDDIYSLNESIDHEITSCFTIREGKNVQQVKIYLFDDIDGFATIKRALLGNFHVTFEVGEKYWPKSSSMWTIEVPASNEDEMELTVVWTAKKFESAY